MCYVRTYVRTEYVCVEVRTLGKHEVILLQMNSPWKYYSLHPLGLNKAESKLGKLFVADEHSWPD